MLGEVTCWLLGLQAGCHPFLWADQTPAACRAMPPLWFCRSLWGTDIIKGYLEVLI